ncbi:hypothetical protein LCGC14_3042070, partial [marine sediment metagenome]
MTYALQRDSLVRTRQELLVIGVGECANRYADQVQQLLQYTEQIDNAIWVKTSVGVVANGKGSPAGQQTADTCTFSATNDAITQTVTGEVVTSKGFTGSVWLRRTGPPATETVTLRIRNAGSTESGVVQVTVGIATSVGWVRFWVNKLFTAGPVDDVVFEIVRLAGDDMT